MFNVNKSVVVTVGCRSLEFVLCDRNVLAGMCGGGAGEDVISFHTFARGF